jgi:hypothetical protein
MKAIRYPLSSATLSEARLYARESFDHTWDYDGWKDQKLKLARVTYGKFGQLWVAEFCKANGIECKKDTSSPRVSDDRDLTICGYSVDVKTTIKPKFVGQVSPGVINKPCDYFCFLITDINCSFIEPVGFMDYATYRDVAIEVKDGEIIPGTSTVQRYPKSFFLPEDAPIIPFVKFLMRISEADHG